MENIIVLETKMNMGDGEMHLISFQEKSVNPIIEPETQWKITLMSMSFAELNVFVEYFLSND